MYVLIIFLMFGAGVFVVALISAGLGTVAVITIRRHAKQRRHGWWVFGITTAVLFAGALTFVHSWPASINIPHSVDFKKMILNSVSYGSSLGVAAAVACVVTLLIPRATQA